MTELADRNIEAALDLAERSVDEAPTCQSPLAVADSLLAAGEAILVEWHRCHGRKPTADRLEGFRILALHRQGAHADISFNACRETCRELVYLRNVVALSVDKGDLAQSRHHLKLQAMVLGHLALFVGGKLRETGLGDFCCSSRPLRDAGSGQGAQGRAAMRPG